MPATTDPLPSWMETGARQAIVRFVEAVTGADREGYVPPDERVAVFDNDGTLWCEKPMPIELGFILQRGVLRSPSLPSRVAHGRQVSHGRPLDGRLLQAPVQAAEVEGGEQLGEAVGHGVDADEVDEHEQ